jgi:hypothetical protein
MARKLFTLSAMMIMALSSLAQQARITEKIIELGKTDNRTMHHLDVITNRFGGRLVGSDAYENAALWCASEFRNWGMEVIMDKAGSVPVGFNHGPWFGKLLSDNGMILHFATPSYTAGTKGVQRGSVLIEPKSQAEFDNMKGALKGAWVLIGGKNMCEAGILGVIQSSEVPIRALYDRISESYIGSDCSRCLRSRKS